MSTIPKKVLILEDEAVVALELAALLRNLGYDVVSLVSRTEDALTEAARLAPDLAMIDLALQSEQTPVNTAKELELRFGVSTVFLCSHVGLVPEEVMARRGLLAYVSLPFEERELQLVIDGVLYRASVERRFRQVERWWALTLDGTKEGIVATESSGRIVIFNTEAEVITGWLKHEALGRPLDEIFRVVHEKGRRAAPSLLTQVMAEGVVVNLGEDRLLIRRDAAEIPIQESAALVRDGEGRVGGIIVVFRHTSGRQRFETERRALEGKMRDAQRLESVGLMAGGIAHDFNNQLGAILGHVELTRAEPSLPAKVVTSLDKIERSLMRAADLCRQMLVYAGRAKPTRQPLLLNDVAVEVVKFFKTNLKPNVFVKTLLDLKPPTIVADRRQVSQAILNLLGNALDAIGTREGTITVKTHTLTLDRAGLDGLLFGEDAEPGAFGVLEVADTGIGMSPDTIGRIFDPFFTTKFTGRGLGLASVAGILRSHGGALRVESDPGRGSAFQLVFPSHMQNNLFPENDPAQPAAGRTTPLATVLVADDDDAIRAFAKWVVERAGYRAVVARDGDQAMNEFRSNPAMFSLILLDLTMPRMSGEQVLAEVRKLRRDIPIVFMTGYGEDAVNAGDLAEISGFLQKPFSPDELRAVLAQHLSTKSA